MNKDVKAICPNCNKEFNSWDKCRNRFKKHCSMECYKKDVINHKWVCTFPGCKKRFKHHKGLEKHIIYVHGNLEEYIENYLKLKNIIIEKHCPICGKKRKPSILYGGFEQCICVAVNNKIKLKQKELSECQDETEKSKIRKSIGGLKGLLKRHGPKSDKIKVQPLKSFIETENKLDLIEIGSLFFGLYDQNKSLYTKSYEILTRLQKKLPLCDYPEYLRKELIDNGWYKQDEHKKYDPVSMYIPVYYKSKFEIYCKEITCVKPEKLDQLKFDISIDEDEMEKHIINNGHCFDFKYFSSDNMDLNYTVQSWFRYRRNYADKGIQYPLNPFILYHIWKQIH